MHGQVEPHHRAVVGESEHCRHDHGDHEGFVQIDEKAGGFHGSSVRATDSVLLGRFSCLMSGVDRRPDPFSLDSSTIQRGPQLVAQRAAASLKLQKE